MTHVPAAAEKNIKSVMAQMLRFRFNILFLFIVLIFTGSAVADTHILFGGASVNPGDTVAIPVIITSSATVCGYQFNIPHISDPLEFIQIQFSDLTPPVDSWAATSNKLYNGIHKVIGFDDRLQGFSGASHEIAELLIHIDADAAPGNYPLRPEHQIICDPDGNVLSSYVNTEYLTVTGSDVIFDMQDDTIGYYDRSKHLTILMSTFTPIAGFQFDIVDSADIFTGIVCNNPFGEGWDVYCAEQDNGALRILASATSGEPLPDTSDYILIITVQTNSEVQAGSYPVLLENLIVSDENSGSLIGSGLGAVIEVDSTLLSSFDLFSPVSGYSVGTTDQNIDFLWQQSRHPSSSEISYNVSLQVLDYSALTMKFLSGGGGRDTSFTLNIGYLNQVIDSMGIPVQNSQQLQWWVTAVEDQRKRQSESTYDLEIHGFTTIDDQACNNPTAYKLFRNYPNPFNSQTTIRFEIPESAVVKLTIFNLLGQEVLTLADSDFPMGTYSFHWDGHNRNGKPVKSGIYLVSFRAGNYYSTQKIVFLK